MERHEFLLNSTIRLCCIKSSSNRSMTWKQIVLLLQGLGLRPGVIDGAISISAVQVCALCSYENVYSPKCNALSNMLLCPYAYTTSAVF